MRNVDLNAAARIDEAIEATGATTIDFEVQRRPAQGMGESMTSLMGGGKPVQFQFTVEPDGLDVDDPDAADDEADAPEANGLTDAQAQVVLDWVNDHRDALGIPDWVAVEAVAAGIVDEIEAAGADDV